MVILVRILWESVKEVQVDAFSAFPYPPNR